MESKLLDEIETTLGVLFNNKELLITALTHSSYINEQKGNKMDSFERLEFLGDAIVGTVTAQELYSKHLNWGEGELTNHKSLFINGENLSQAANRLQLGKYLFLSKGAEKTGTRHSIRILASVFESVVGAIFLDQGYEPTRLFIKRTLIDNHIGSGSGTSDNNKNRLQIYLQKRNNSLPTYKVTGQTKTPIFTVEAKIGQKIIGIGKGRTKQIAEQKAAGEALNLLIGSDL